MQDSKITLSPEAVEAIQNIEIFRIKADAVSGISALFEELQIALVADSARFSHLPSYLFATSGKISRGENYKGLPYMILDFPRIFRRDEVFAFRSMFWWGHHFAFTIHLSGMSCSEYGEALIRNAARLAEKQTFIAVHTDEWDHTLSGETVFDLGAEPLRAVEMMRSVVRRNNFIKISRTLPLSESERLVSFGRETYGDMMEALSQEPMV